MYHGPFVDMLSCCQIMIDSVRNVLWRSDRDLNTISWRIHVTRKCQLSHNMSLQANDCNIMDSVVILIQNDRMSQYYAVVGNQFSLWRARLSVDSRLCWWKVGLRYAPVSWSWFKHPHKLPTGKAGDQQFPTSGLTEKEVKQLFLICALVFTCNKFMVIKYKFMC